MLKKYLILFGIIISIVLLVIAAMYYPGGSQTDKNSVGYDWKNNYLSNLFSNKAVNGADNSSRPWAIAGVLFLGVSFAAFFIEFSNKIAASGEDRKRKGAAKVIRYCGIGAAVAAFLAVTPYHDLMVTVAGTLALVSMFYVTIIVFTSKLQFFKILCVFCLLAFYCCNYIYYTRSYLEALPIMQKTSLVIMILWMLCLQYFTTEKDFWRGKKLVR